MLYRKIGQTNELVSILGFGCMRLPVIKDDPSKIDYDMALPMIYHAIDAGINYFDTAYPYHNGQSEIFLGHALKGYLREKVKIATKLPVWNIDSREDMDMYLDIQLERLNTDYIDFYLVHSLNKDFWSKLSGIGLLDFLENSKKKGKILHIGFSFHDDVDTFKQIVDSYAWDFCQIQYNIMDEYYQAGRLGLEYAASKGLGIAIMEPMRGGSLVNMVPSDILSQWKQIDSKRSPAYWCLHYLWDRNDISLVLSGMNTMEQLQENINSAKTGFTNILSENEKRVISTVGDMYRSKLAVNCTGCRYCLPCPAGVYIPLNFKYLNNISIYGDIQTARKQYINHLGSKRKASNCNKCGECEPRCPQNIPIRKMLKITAQKLENYEL